MSRCSVEIDLILRGRIAQLEDVAGPELSARFQPAATDAKGLEKGRAMRYNAGIIIQAYGDEIKHPGHSPIQARGKNFVKQNFWGCSSIGRAQGWQS
jgi:hypothetical protein